MRIRANLLFVALVLMTSGCGNSTREIHEYKYIGQDSGRVLTFDVVDKEVDNGHRIYGFEFCQDSSYHVCLYGEFTIAVAKGGLNIGREWKVAGSKFSVVKIDQAPGTIYNYTILAESSRGSMEIFFNEINGIWGLRLVGGEMFKSEGFCGLGCKLK